MDRRSPDQAAGLAVVALLAVLATTAGACSYPTFGFGPGTGGGGAGTGGMTGSGQQASSSSASASSASASSASGSSTSASSGGGASSVGSGGSGGGSGTGGAAPVCPPHLVISQLQTRGDGGARDEFVVLYNPTDQDVTLDKTWSLVGQSSTGSVSTKWQGCNSALCLDVIQAHAYFLVTGTGYSLLEPPDDVLVDDISDAGRLALVRGTTEVDVVCFAYASTLSAVEKLVCPGTPAVNPHDDTTATDKDQSIARKPYDCSDSGNNAADFMSIPSDPESASTPPMTFP